MGVQRTLTKVFNRRRFPAMPPLSRTLAGWSVCVDSGNSAGAWSSTWRSTKMEKRLHNGLQWAGKWDKMVCRDGLDFGTTSTSTGADPVSGAHIAPLPHQAMARRQCVGWVEGEGSKVMGSTVDDKLLRCH
jgi:hypothetical protein